MASSARRALLRARLAASLSDLEGMLVAVARCRVRVLCEASEESVTDFLAKCFGCLPKKSKALLMVSGFDSTFARSTPRVRFTNRPYLPRG